MMYCLYVNTLSEIGKSEHLASGHRAGLPPSASLQHRWKRVDVVACLRRGIRPWLLPSSIRRCRIDLLLSLWCLHTLLRRAFVLQDTLLSSVWETPTVSWCIGRMHSCAEMSGGPFQRVQDCMAVERHTCLP